MDSGRSGALVTVLRGWVWVADAGEVLLTFLKGVTSLMFVTDFTSIVRARGVSLLRPLRLHIIMIYFDMFCFTNYLWIFFVLGIIHLIRTYFFPPRLVPQ